MAFTSDGEIVVAGGSGQIGGRSPASVTVAMYRPNGSLDPRFGRGGIVTNTVGVQSWATGLAIQPDGKIVIVGPFVAEVGMPDGLGAMRFQSA